MRILVAATAIAVGLPAAHAQDTSKRDWLPVRTSEGCIYYQTREIAEVRAQDGIVESWSGSCTSGQPINGAGTLHWTKRDNQRGDWIGHLVGGYWDGQMTMRGEFREDGVWQRDEGDGLVLSFTMGCTSDQNSFECIPASPGRAPQTSAVVAASRPAPAPPPAPATIAPGHVHNPANDASKCVVTENVGPSGRQEFVNKCPWIVWVQWPGGLEDISPAESYPTFQKTAFRFFACRKDPKTLGGLYQTREMAAAGEVVCDAK
ncbi:hypothetical protein BH09PSE4_BH09PSE4_05570 [soil metagenome]